MKPNYKKENDDIRNAFRRGCLFNRHLLKFINHKFYLLRLYRKYPNAHHKPLELKLSDYPNKIQKIYKPL